MQKIKNMIKKEKELSNKIDKFFSKLFERFKQKFPNVIKILIGFKNVFIVICFIILLFSIINQINSYIKMGNIENDIKSLVQLKVDKENLKGNVVIANNFDLESDTLPFANFTTIDSEGGNCMGYNIFEMYYYNKFIQKNSSNEFLSNYNGNLADLPISEHDKEFLYSFRSNNESVFDYNMFLKSEDKANYKKLVLDSYNKIGFYVEILYNKFLNKDLDIYRKDINNFKFENEGFGNIIKDISKLQNEKSATYLSKGYYSTSALLGVSTNKYDLTDINFLINNVDRGMLSVIGIYNMTNRHALLVYGYEKLDENNIRFYIKDSNFPIIKGDNLSEEDKLINEDIKKFYNLFTRDLTEDNWSYVYMPTIMGKVLDYGFNSFIPNTKLGYYLN